MIDTDSARTVPTLWQRRLGVGPAVLFLLCVMLFVPGLRWGLPGSVSWSQDTIAGMRTVNSVDTWPEHWLGRYPPLHYFLLRTVYEPIIRHWQAKGEWYQLPQAGRYFIAEPQSEKMGVLFLAARVVSVLAGIAAVLGIWATTRVLTGDVLAAFCAGLSLAIGAAFVYFAHLGNVDVPAIAWFAWSAYFYARLTTTSVPSRALARAESQRKLPSWYQQVLSFLSRSRRLSPPETSVEYSRSARAKARGSGGNISGGGASGWDALGLGLLGGFAVATKDSTAGVYPGMAVALVVSGWLVRQRHDRSGVALVRAMLDWRWLMGIAAFALPYLYISGAFHHWEAYANHLSYWLNPPPGSLHARQLRYDNTWALLQATLRYAAGAVGWPMLLVMLASTMYAVLRKGRLAILMLLPVASYYVIVIAPIHFIYSRFLFAPLALLSVLVGVAAADWVRNRCVSMSVKLVTLAGVVLPTVGYAAAMNAEMLTDSRYAAETWFRDHVEPSASVGAFAIGYEPKLKPQYLPRLQDMDYATYPVVMAGDWFDRPEPEYLVLTSYNFEDFDVSQRACMSDLLAGRLGYETVAFFKGRYLGTDSSWLSLAGWGAPTPGKISPRLIVMKKQE